MPGDGDGIPRPVNIFHTLPAPLAAASCKLIRGHGRAAALPGPALGLWGPGTGGGGAAAGTGPVLGMSGNPKPEPTSEDETPTLFIYARQTAGPYTRPTNRGGDFRTCPSSHWG